MCRCAAIFAMLLSMSQLLEAQTVSQHAKQFAEVTQKLRTIGIQQNPHGDLRMAPEIPPLLRQLNSSLRELLIEVLRKYPNGFDVQGKIQSELERAGWREIPPYKWSAYGELIPVEIGATSNDNLLVVITRLWIPCDTQSPGAPDPDSALYVFQKEGKLWRLILATETDYNPDHMEEQVAFQFELSPPDEQNRWYVAVATVPASCYSTSESLTYRILRPGASPDKPIEIIRGREPLDEDFDPHYRLRAEMDWFSLTRGAHRRLDGELAVFVSRWQIADTSAKRIHPLAYEPEDFLDYWVQMGWQDAQPWSAQSALSDLEAWHGKLNLARPGSAQVLFVQPCGATGWEERWQIGLEFDRRGGEILGSESLFATVFRKRGVFYVESIDVKRPPGCPGETRPKERLLRLP